MRIIYSLFLYLFSPLVLLYLKKRGSKNNEYNKNWHERFGINLHNPANKPIIWLYAVSVGETRAMIKLIELIEIQYPNYQILITNMTPTGRDTAKKLYPNAIVHYVPYDLPHAVINFYKTFKPQIGLIMETEIWPNIAFYAKEFKIPLYLVNARLSDKSFNSYNKIRAIIKPVLNNFSGILCQDKSSYDNFKNLGFINQMDIIGNMKFDLVINNNFNELAIKLKAKISNKKVVAFASTRDGDEKLILDNLPKDFEYLLVIIPRHPERFSVVEELIKEKHLKYQKRSDITDIEIDTQVLLGDSMGEMLLYYSISDLAIIGGSFNGHGGQNPIEPIFMQKPVIFGLSMFNFKEVSRNALDDKCAIQVNNMMECLNKVNEILESENQYLEYKDNCNVFIKVNSGASKRVLDKIKNISFIKY